MEKLEAGLAIKEVATIMTRWLEDTAMPTEEALEQIGQTVDEWRRIQNG